MGKNIKETLEEAVIKTECEIKKALQKFHDDTGMIPESVSFDLLEVSSSERMGVYMVNSVNLSSHT